MWFRNFEKFLKFGVTGVVNTLITYLFYCVFVYIGLQYQLASSLGFLAGILNSYYMNKLWTFKCNDNHYPRQVLMFIVVNLTALGVNLIVLTLLVQNLNKNIYFSQVVAIFGSMIVNYLGQLLFVFRFKKNIFQ